MVAQRFVSEPGDGGDYVGVGDDPQEGYVPGAWAQTFALFAFCVKECADVTSVDGLLREKIFGFGVKSSDHIFEKELSKASKTPRGYRKRTNSVMNDEKLFNNRFHRIVWRSKKVKAITG